MLVDSLAEARAYCEAAVQTAPATRFDVFDAQGRAEPALLTDRAPVARARARHAPARDSQAARDRVVAHHRRRAPAYLDILAIPRTSKSIFPGVIGINMVLAGGRFLWFNLVVRETERARGERLARVESGRGGLT